MPELGRVVTTDAEIDEALIRAKRYAKYDRRVMKVSYSKVTERLRLVFEDGTTYSVPRALIQGLAGADERDIKRIQILGDGTGLLWPVLDVAHYIPGLLAGVYGSERWMTELYKQKKLKLVAKLS
jgi:predicted TPR repeat methyltransferase